MMPEDLQIQDPGETDVETPPQANDHNELAIEAEVQKRVKALRRKELHKKKKNPQEKVDATKIKRAVLTDDGYVCPAKKEDLKNVPIDS